MENLLITDIDGTLINDGKFSSFKSAIDRLPKNLDIIFSTGRNESLRGIFKEETFDSNILGWVISNGSAYVKDGEIYYIFLDAAIQSSIYCILQSVDLKSIYTYICDSNGSKRVMSIDDFSYKKNIYEIKICIPKGDFKTTEYLISSLSTININLIVDLSSEKYNFLQLISKGASKLDTANNIANLSSYRNVYLAGDDSNDFSLYLYNGNNRKRFIISEKLSLNSDIKKINSLMDIFKEKI